MKTAVVERAPTLGGRCLNEACIPAKAMLRAADVLSRCATVPSSAIAAKAISFDIDGAGKHRDKVVKTLTGGVAGLFKKHKIEVLEGRAALAGEGSVAVDDNDVETGKIVLATGSVPLPVPGTSSTGA